MLKKVTTFFSPQVARKLNDAEFASSSALRLAIQFPIEVLGACVRMWTPNFYSDESPHPLSSRIRGAHKYLHMGHSKGESLRRAYKQATRIEVHLFFWSAETVISLRVSFYRQGKSPIFRLYADFPLDEGSSPGVGAYLTDI